jgi:hypothetical protein
MTTYSQSDLATRVLRDLGLIGAEEVPSAADLQWSEETVGSEVALLGSIGLPIWNGSDLSVPLEYLAPLSRRIGLAVAPSFGLLDTASALLAMREAERTLTVMANPRGGNPLPLAVEPDRPVVGAGWEVRALAPLSSFGKNQ